MNYFTEEMWLSLNIGLEVNENRVRWYENEKKYRKILASISGRLHVKTYKYFSQIGFHDFRLEKMELIHNEYGKKPVVQVILYVTYDENTFRIHFTNVLKLEIKAAENFCSYRGIDDWGYEEILPIDDKTLSFEVLFASGTTIYIAFPNKTLKVDEVELPQSPRV